MVMSEQEFADEYGISLAEAHRILTGYRADPCSSEWDSIRAILVDATGVVCEAAPPPPATGIVGALNSVSSWFYSIYLEVNGWVWPFWHAAPFFYQLCLLFNTLAFGFSDFLTLVNYLQSKISQILSWSAIWSLLVQYAQPLLDVLKGLAAWWNSIWSEIGTWWTATSVTVQGWISTATQYFNSVATAWSNFWNNLWPQLTTSFNSLKSAWDNFWKVTFPNLVSFTWLTTWWNDRLKDIDDWIDSKIKECAPFWEGWQDMRTNVLTFFTDPVEFIWERFTDWFLGPEG